MVFQSLVNGMEQTCRLKNAKCIKSTWLQKSQSILWLIITQIMFLYWHMTGEVIIQLPGYCLCTDIWQEKSPSSYPDNVSMQSYDRRSCTPCILCITDFIQEHHDNQNSRMTYNNKYINYLYFKCFTDQRKLSWRAETMKNQCFISSQAIVLAINNKKL
jgi:hypothetical protein